MNSGYWKGIASIVFAVFLVLAFFGAIGWLIYSSSTAPPPPKPRCPSGYALYREAEGSIEACFKVNEGVVPVTR